MISQLLSQTQMSAGPAGSEPRPAAGEAPSAEGGFSALLAMLGTALAPVAPEDGEGTGQGEGEARGEVAGGETAGGGTGGELPVALAGVPAIAGTGKTLPAGGGELPPAALANTPATPAGPASPAIPATADGANLHPAGKATGQTADQGQPASAQAQIPASRPMVALEVAPRAQAPQGESAAGGPATGPANGASVQATTLAADTAGGREAGQRDGAGHARAAQGEAPVAAPRAAAEASVFAAAAPAAPAGATTAVQPLSPMAAPAAPGEGATPFSADKPAIETPLARELGRIVDSLASAREAVTAKAATLALDHAEFGDLSLRFDQRRDGQLSVQLSAADPEAHRAIAAAVAERPAPAFAQGDGAPANGTGQAGSGPSARAGAEREGNADGHGPDGNPAEGNGRDRRDGGRDARPDGGSQPGTPRSDGRAAVYA